MLRPLYRDSTSMNCLAHHAKALVRCGSAQQRRLLSTSRPLFSSSSPLQPASGDAVQPVGRVNLLRHSHNATISIPLPSGKVVAFAIKPWQPVSHLLTTLKQEDPSIVSAEVLVEDGQGLQWARTATLQDVFKYGFKNATSPGFSLQLNDQMLTVDLPTLKERVQEQEEELSKLRAELEPLDQVRHACDQKAERHANRLVYGGLLALVSEWGVLFRMTYWEYSWDVVEPIAFFLTFANTVLAYGFYLRYRRDFTCEVLDQLTLNNKKLQLYKKAGLSIDHYQDLRNKIEELEKEIKDIEKDYE